MDQHGIWVGGSVHNLRITTSVMEKLWRIYHELRLAWEMGFRMILLNSDQQVAIELLHSSQQVAGAKGLLTAKCKDLPSRDQMVEITHIYREGNIDADWIVNWAIQFPVGCHDMSIPPPALIAILQVDTQGGSLFLAWSTDVVLMYFFGY